MKKSGAGPIQGNILIVDDTPANLTLLSGMLKEKGHKVRPVPSGKLALKAVESELPDLILLDINMPEMNGIEFLRERKKDPVYSAIPVFVLTTQDEAALRDEAMSLGAKGFIVKPFQKETLLQAINNGI